DGVAAQQCEELFAILYEVQKKSHFVVKITEAPHYRRFVAQHESANADQHRGHPRSVAMPDMLKRSEGPGHTVGLAPHGVNAGKGFAFVSHTGDVYPSGFLPISAGNVRTQSLAAIYRDSELFRTLRDPAALRGRCGRCEYNDFCGGS